MCDRASQVLAQGVPPGVPKSFRAVADHGTLPVLAQCMLHVFLLPDPREKYGDLEPGRHAAGLGTWRCRGLEARCRRADVEANRYGDLEAHGGVDGTIHPVG